MAKEKETDARKTDWNRRRFLKTSAAGAAAAVVAGQVGRLSGGDPLAWATSDTAEDRAISGVKGLKLAAGTEVKILAHEGSFGNLTGDNNELSEAWEKATGTKIKIIGVPITEGFQKIILESTAKTGNYDIMMTQQRHYGDVFEAGVAHDLTEWAQKYNPVLDDNPNDGVITGASQSEYKGRVVAFPNDGDFLTLFLRRDLLEDTKEQQEFEKRYGYPLQPPQTWEEYHDQMEFFTRPDQGLYGSVSQKNKYWGYLWWCFHYASQADPVAWYFDDEMKPLVNSPQGVRATKIYVDELKWANPAQLSWSWSETYPAMAKGAGYSKITFPSYGKYNANPAVESAVADKIIGALVPGSVIGDKLIRRSIMAFGNPFIVNSYSEHPELAYLWCQWLVGPKVSVDSIQSKAGFLDPFRYNHFKAEPILTAYTPEVLAGTIMDAEVGIPDGVKMWGSEEYGLELDKNLQEACTGKQTAEQAMENTAKAWEEITERKGRETQIKAWLDLKKQFPTKTFPVPAHASIAAQRYEAWKM